MIDVVIVPQGAEFKVVQKALAKSPNPPPKIIKIPIGTTNISQTLEQQNFWQVQPKTVLMLGLCGSLTTSHKPGKAILYETSRLDSHRDLLSTSSQPNKFIQSKIKPVLASGITQDNIVTSIKVKQQLAKDFAVEVVDMESYGYLQLLQQNKIQVSILRIISDDLSFDLPNLENTIDDYGSIKPLKMTVAMLKQPIKSTRFIKNSLYALNQLEAITKRIFA